MNYFEKIKTQINLSIKEGLIDETNGVLSGYSGKKMIGMLQRLGKEFLNENTCYVEVGVFQGLTLLSVAKSVSSINATAYGIDNFAYFDKNGKNYGIVKDRTQKLNLTNAQVINLDYEEALENLSKHIGNKKVGLYFVDGPHDYRSQLVCLLLIKPFLADNAIIVVDDCNYRHVRQANRDFLISHPEFKLVFQSYGKAHPLNLSGADKKEVEEGWWNGVNVMTKDDYNLIEQKFPETYRSRLLYENEHAIHTAKHPDVVAKLIRLFDFISGIFKTVFPSKAQITGKYKEMNTFSENLPVNNFSEPKK
ncbi:MAG: class I SAM-dependent methyltransferase [Bacteroidia bacterium]|nr:class I SAM-dependent methyltransferase [Bacteroidia bacterium]